jgi:hypothetical protein
LEQFFIRRDVQEEDTDSRVTHDWDAEDTEMTKRRRAEAGLPKHARRKSCQAKVDALNRQWGNTAGIGWCWALDPFGRVMRTYIDSWY